MSKEIALRAALENRQKFGKADVKAVLGKIMQLAPELRNNRKDAENTAKEAVKEANKLSQEDAERRLNELPELGLEKKEKKELSLEGDPKHVVLRFEPSPSGPMHIGHTYPLLLNKTLAEKHEGKLILRISDTNPENIDPKAYDLLPEDGKWLTNGFIKDFYVQSDRMHTYYKHAEEAIKKNYVYVCSCSSENFKKLVDKSEPCPCRDLSVEENMARWKQMLDDAPQGSYVVRVKTDLNHKNPAMRDWPALRINTETHPRQGTKYRVWPLLNWAVAIDDHEMGVTHTLRAKDHMDNAKRQKLLLDHFGWKDPIHLYVGRINFEGFRLSTSQTRKKIEAREYSGWDDIRLPFIRALKRRGYQPLAFQTYAVSMGITQNDKSVALDEYYKALNAFNKDILDPISDRHFFIADPVEVLIDGCPTLEPEIELHPGHPERGHRKFKTGSKFYLDKKDLDSVQEGKIYRLMDCLNFTKRDGKLVFHSQDYETYKAKGTRIMHYLPVENAVVETRMRMPDNTVLEGKAEHDVEKLKEGAIIQFERFGFARLDSKENMEFWFCHK
ncbi:MAG: glutamate--tRNA ligase [Candidatus Woesearchaeota archaeon]